MEGTGGTKHALKGMDSPENGDRNSVPSALRHGGWMNGRQGRKGRIRTRQQVILRSPNSEHRVKGAQRGHRRNVV